MIFLDEYTSTETSIKVRMITMNELNLTLDSIKNPWYENFHVDLQVVYTWICILYGVMNYFCDILFLVDLFNKPIKYFYIYFSFPNIIYNSIVYITIQLNKVFDNIR